jgi:hypothetical protein
VHDAHRHALRDAVAEQHRRHVGEQHPERGACHHTVEGVVARSECDGRDLRLVTDLRQRDDAGGY